MRFRTIHVGLSAAVALSCLLAAPQAQAQKYRVVDLGPGIGRGITSDGTVAGTAGAPWQNVPAGGWHAALWAPDGTRTLLPEWPGDIASDAANGYASLPPFLWTQDKGITFMQGNAGFRPYSVHALNDQDMAVGGGARTADPQASGGFVWTPTGGLKELSSPVKTFTDIIPTTVNAQGLVAGFVRDWPTGRTKLFSWSAKSGVTILMPFTYYAETLRPISIDKTLRVIGNREYAYPKGTIGFVWNILTGPRDINTLLVDNGPANAPIATIGALTGVNSQGQISATATINGAPHAVRLDPVR